MNMDYLNNAFEIAKKDNDPFVFVRIEVEGILEVIVIPAVSFEEKQKFYNKAYTQDLVHCMNSQVRITGFSQGGLDALEFLLD